MEKPIVPADVIATLLSKLRDTIFKAAEDQTAARVTSSTQLYDDRVFDLT